MFRYEFLVLGLDGEKSVYSVDTESEFWMDAASEVEGQIVKWLCRIDLTPQKFLAW